MFAMTPRVKCCWEALVRYARQGHLKPWSDHQTVPIIALVGGLSSRAPADGSTLWFCRKGNGPPDQSTRCRARSILVPCTRFYARTSWYTSPLGWSISLVAGSLLSFPVARSSWTVGTGCASP
jgi:hypothetical protein